MRYSYYLLLQHFYCAHGGVSGSEAWWRCYVAIMEESLVQKRCGDVLGPGIASF